MISSDINLLRPTVGGRNFPGASTRRTLSALAVALSAVLILSLGRARASDTDEETLIRQGIESRRKRNDVVALELFRKAYDVRRSPRAAAQMGMAEIALGRWVDAEAHLQEAISVPSDPWIAKHQATLQDSLSRSREHLGRLEILGRPRGAEIVIEDVVVGTLPLAKPLTVRSGDCRFVIRAVGYEPVSRNVDVAPGDLTRETVVLSARPAADARAADTGAATQVAVVTSDANAQSVPPAHPRADANDDDTGAAKTSGNHLTTVGVVLGTAGVAAVAAGVVFGLKARSSGEEASRQRIFDANADSAGRRYQALQYVGYAVGAAFIVAGVTTFVMGINSDGESGPSAVAVLPVQGGGVAALRGRF